MKNKVSYIVILSFIALFITACSGTSLATTQDNILKDMTEYSRISYNELVTMMGEPNDSETWNNTVNSGTYEITIYSYEKDDIHYEFHVFDDSVVRATLYSSKYWTNTGSDFTYDGKKNTLLSMFGVVKSDYTKVTADTNYTYTISPVNDKIAEFSISDINTNTNTFGTAKATYNVKYYE